MVAVGRSGRGPSVQWASSGPIRAIPTRPSTHRTTADRRNAGAPTTVPPLTSSPTGSPRTDGPRISGSLYRKNPPENATGARSARAIAARSPPCRGRTSWASNRTPGASRTRFRWTGPSRVGPATVAWAIRRAPSNAADAAVARTRSATVGAVGSRWTTTEAWANT
ncbi:MAG: hypothetical protein ABMB14_23695 [Myxococcota bacterium]